MLPNFAHSSVNERQPQHTRRKRKTNQTQMQILNSDLSDIFLRRVADHRGVQRIPFLPLKPAKRGQNAETVLTDLLTIFARFVPPRLRMPALVCCQVSVQFVRRN